MKDILPLYGPEWNDPMGTSTAAGPGSPHNRLCAGIVTLIDSEKLSDIVRGWVTAGLPDPDDPTTTSPYADAPLQLIVNIAFIGSSIYLLVVIL